MDQGSKKIHGSIKEEKKPPSASLEKRPAADGGDDTGDDAACDNDEHEDVYMVSVGSSPGSVGSEGAHLLHIPVPDDSQSSNFLMENKNTNRKTGADMKILVSYLRSLNEKRLPESIPPIELDKYLSSFFMVVRKFDGAEYEPCSLRAMLASIERYLKLKCYPTSLTRDIHFAKTRAALKLKQQMLKQMGKGVKSQISSTSHVMEQRLAQLCKSQEFGPYTPVSILFSLCFVFVMNLKMRKATEHKKLLWGDIMLGIEEETGREYLAFSPQMLHRTPNSHLRQSRQMILGRPDIPEQDPVALYKLYAEKRPIAANHRYSPFYLGVNVNQPAPAQSWYRPCALGMNKLNEMVRQIRDLTGMSGPMGSSDSTAATGDGESNCDSTNVSSIDNEDAEFIISQTDSNCPRSELKSEMDAYHHSATHPDSELDSSDSLSYQSLSFNEDTADDNADQQDNCHGGVSEYSTDDNVATDLNNPDQTDYIDLSTAKQQLSGILQRMDILDLVAFDQWLKKMKIARDPTTGVIVCREDVQGVNISRSRKRSHDSDISSEVNPDKSKGDNLLENTNITLNISLTPQAILGGGPVTVTAHTSRPNQITDLAEEIQMRSKNLDRTLPTKPSNTSGIAKSPYPVQIIPSSLAESSATKYPRVSSSLSKKDGPYSGSSIAQRVSSSSLLRQISSNLASSASARSASSISTHQLPAHSTAISLTHRSEPSIVKTVLQQTLRPMARTDLSQYMARSAAVLHQSLATDLTNGHTSTAEHSSGPVFPKPEPV